MLLEIHQWKLNVQSRNESIWLNKYFVSRRNCNNNAKIVVHMKLAV